MHVFKRGLSAHAQPRRISLGALCPSSAPITQSRRAHAAAVAPKWKPSSALDEWVQREARPISLRQLTFFGRSLTESRLMDSANYCRLELPTRLAHRLRDIQTLPYVVVANPHLAHVYESYLQAFERFRRVPEIRSVEDNDRYCKVLEETLKEHATVIPRLAIGVLEVRNLMKPDETDKFMTTMLRARISRRVIAEQHLALSETFNSPWHFPNAQAPHDQEAVGEIFLRCNAREIVESCGKTTQELIKRAYGDHVEIPEIKIYGHLDATFPYILSHLEYIIGELLRNSIQAVIEQRKSKDAKPPPIEVLICETSQHVIIRISDQGGGIPNDLLPYLWSFSKGPRREKRLQNLARVPKLLGTLQELQVGDKSASELQQKYSTRSGDAEAHRGSLASLTSRAPDLRLGIGLPMSRLYAEYWAGSLEIHSLEGYGVDAFLQISKLGNKNERLTTPAFSKQFLDAHCGLLFFNNSTTLASNAFFPGIIQHCSMQHAAFRMETPVVSTDFKPISHAHPLPFRPSPREQQAKALVANIPMSVNLRGLSFGRSVTVSDVLTPKIRRAPYNKNVNPNHLDAIECWKGLSHTEAVELTMWYQFMHDCLHNDVREFLRKEIVRDLLSSSEAFDEIYLVARILEYLRSKPQRIIDMSFINVVDSMMNMFHYRYPGGSASLSSSWSQFSGGLSLFLHNFVRMQDCFQHSAHGPCIEAKFDFHFAQSALTANCDVAWQPPSIRFLHVPTTRVSGEMYRITPFVWKEIDSPIESLGCDDHVDQVEYTITRSPATFTWDSAKRCFITTVGHFRDGKPHTVETVVMATVNTPFSENVIFERRSRWSIVLDVRPTHQPLTPPDNTTPLHEVYLESLRQLSSTKSAPETVVHNKHVTYSSSQKRKASKPGLVDAATVIKRRRHELMLDTEDELSDAGFVLGDDPFASRLLQRLTQEAEHERNNACISPGGSQSSTHCVIQPTETQCGCGISSSSASQAVSEESVPSDDIGIPDRGSLNQEDILYNYHEFVQRKIFKDAGIVISPVSDGERRAYESIFFEDGDDWSPVTDGSSSNMDTVMSEKQQGAHVG